MVENQSRYLPEQRETADWLARLDAMPTAELLAGARDLARAGWGDVVTYSPKVFIPLTQLCRDVCAYCTFAHAPRPGQPAYMTMDEALAVARKGAAAGCTEALFTLGELPERRYGAARDELSRLGFPSTPAYLAEVARRVFAETGLLPHINAGLLTDDDLTALREVSASQGMMLESTSLALLEKGGPHHGSHSKAPHLRLDMIARAGRLRIPFTSGILTGIGETRLDRIEALLALRNLHAEFGHIQEVIVQNFQPKPGTRMAAAPALPMDDMLWTIAAARLILGSSMSIQAPPNLSHQGFPALLAAGINDWGGVSPVTPDFVNPEAPWPSLSRLREATEAAGLALAPRLTVYPRYLSDDRWLAPKVRARALQLADADGLSRADPWTPGDAARTLTPPPRGRTRASMERMIAALERGEAPGPDTIAALFRARDGDVAAIAEAADAMRRRQVGDSVRYVVNRNINYTNICKYHCSFCAFSKGRGTGNLRGAPYEVDLDEVSRRAAEAWERGATEVCLQGGIHPRFTGRTYLDLLRAARAGAPRIHVHAFSPLEVHHGAQTLGIGIDRYLAMLQGEGLGSLPGTSAEILDDTARAILCPDKLDTRTWIDVVERAHRQGLPTTATIMFGHIDDAAMWARHLTEIRTLQERTGGLTEFVPLPFVHMEAPLYRLGAARRGPTSRETILMHALSRLVLGPMIPNIQTSWVKLGDAGVTACLAAGVNDLGGTLMNESISRAAGTMHGQEMAPARMEALIRAAGRLPAQRTTLYGQPQADQRERSFLAQGLAEMTFARPGRGAMALETN